MVRRVDTDSNPDRDSETSRAREAGPRFLHESALAITASLEVKQVLAELVNRCTLAAPDSTVLAYLVDASSNRLELVSGGHADLRSLKPYPGRSADARSEDAGRLTVPFGEGPAGRAAASGRSIRIDGMDMEAERAGRFGAGRVVRSLLALPMVSSGEVLGVIEIGFPHAAGPDSDLVERLDMLASYAAVGISHTRLFERSREMLNLMQSINDRSAAVSSVAQAILDAAHDLHRMLADALQRILSLLGLKAGSIMLANPNGDELHIVVHYRFPQDDATLAPRQRIGMGQPGFAARAALERQTLVVHDVEGDPFLESALEVLRRFGIASLAAMPMISDDTVIGVLQIGSDTSTTLEPGVTDTLRVIAGELTSGIINARKFSRIRADQERFKAVLGSSGDVVLSFDQQGRITLANVAAQRAFGFSVADVLGQPLPKATTNVALNGAVEQAIRSGVRERVGFEVPLADDSVLFCNLSPIADEDDVVVGWVAVMQDVTRFKETERLKSDMILTASHDLRNPVNLTLGALDMLGQSTDNWTATQREVYELAVLGVRRIEALIIDLLDLERVERRVGLTLGECNVSELVQTVYVENRMQAHSKQQSIEAIVPDNTSAVWGDPRRLYQVFSNLVGNAVKYTPAGGCITITLAQADDQVLFEVNDTGKGIPQEAQARVFERFYRVPGSSSIDAGGTGLGLALVKSIVDQHGGRVWVTSQVGVGSTFSVSLPVWKPPADHRPAG